MRSANIVTLFSERPRPSTGPSSFLVSILVHVIAFPLLFIGLKHTPHVDNESTRRYTVRILEAPRIEPERKRSVSSGELHAAMQSSPNGMSSGGAAPSPPGLVQMPQLPTRSQTLVQPDAPPDLVIPPETPVPLVVIWSPENGINKNIVAPPPQEPAVAETRPAIIKRNREPNIADVNISVTPFPSQTPIIAGSTTPLAVHGAEPLNAIPSTSSAQLEQPSPASVLSISSYQAAGRVYIPPANQITSGNPSNTLMAQAFGKSSGAGSGNSASRQSGTGAGDGAGIRAGDGKGTRIGGDGSGGDGAGATNGSGAKGSATVAQGGGGGGAPTGADQGSATGSGNGPGYVPTLTHIALPKDGQFGVVVVGSSLTEQYPEIDGVWSGRLVYTVYLHVGLGKNWILQYSVPSSEEANAGGSITKPDAPWPYDILRPHLSPDDFNANAVMVHGFVNLAGRFERLAMVFPQGFAQAKFLLDALQQWQFRPARQNGRLAAVEVLLIIPEEAD